MNEMTLSATSELRNELSLEVVGSPSMIVLVESRRYVTSHLSLLSTPMTSA